MSGLVWSPVGIERTRANEANENEGTNNNSLENLYFRSFPLDADRL